MAISLYGLPTQRHDWNSLLDSDVKPITERTKERWPRKEVLTEYLGDFAKEQVDAGRISFGTTVKRISRAEGGRFTMELVQQESTDEESSVACTLVIMATGLSQPNVPEKLVGVEHTELYDDLPEDQEKFEAKKVGELTTSNLHHTSILRMYRRILLVVAAIFGLGNAAFETANAMAAYVDFVVNTTSNPHHNLISSELSEIVCL